MMVNKKGISATELINYGKLSTLLTGRKDIIRRNRIPKQHKECIRELETLLEFWMNKHFIKK